MARIGYKYVAVENGLPIRTNIDSKSAEFSGTMNYARMAGFDNREDFLKTHCSVSWVKELHEVLKQVLKRDRKVLSIGSGIGEHEVPLVLAGYNIIASDIIPGVLDRTKKLFPELKIRTLDILNAINSEDKIDDILVTGLIFYYNDELANLFFHRINQMLINNGRLILTERYNDNFLVGLLDTILLPSENLLRNLYLFLVARRSHMVRKAHGYRRSRKEVLKLAFQHGFVTKSIGHAGFGMEITRSTILMRVPFLMTVISYFDQWLHLFQIATIFEFEKVGDNNLETF